MATHAVVLFVIAHSALVFPAKGSPGYRCALGGELAVEFLNHREEPGGACVCAEPRERTKAAGPEEPCRLDQRACSVQCRKPIRASFPKTEPPGPAVEGVYIFAPSAWLVNKDQLEMADDREGVVDSSKTYTHKALARILQRNERWVIRSLIRNGVQCKKVGELIFVSGHQFNLWIQGASTPWQDKDEGE